MTRQIDSVLRLRGSLVITVFSRRREIRWTFETDVPPFTALPVRVFSSGEKCRFVGRESGKIVIAGDKFTSGGRRLVVERKRDGRRFHAMQWKPVRLAMASGGADKRLTGFRKWVISLLYSSVRAWAFFVRAHARVWPTQLLRLRNKAAEVGHLHTPFFCSFKTCS